MLVALTFVLPAVFVTMLPGAASKGSAPELSTPEKAIMLPTALLTPEPRVNV